jgi:HAD superfamily hydrolase (TIGR01490 family)
VRVEVFDVDYTLVRCSTVREFILLGLKEGLIGPSIGVYAPYLFIRNGLAGFSGFDSSEPFPFLSRVPAQDLEDLARRLLVERFVPSLDAEMSSLVDRARSDGSRVLIASSSFSLILAPLAVRLGIEDIVANELELEEGRTTGRLVGQPVYGEGKRDRVLGFLASIGVNPGDCSFYTDSYRDLPLLEAIGRPVAVNPSRRLRRAARDLGWELLDTSISAKGAAHA